MRNKKYPYTSPLPTFYVFGILILLAFVLSSVACSRQITPQEQREQMRAAQTARGEVVETKAEWVQVANDLWRLTDEENGVYCYVYNPTGKDVSQSASRFDCVRS